MELRARPVPERGHRERSRMHPDVRLLGGRYELTALIATGGMGQVWQGRDTLLGRDVAVKVLRSEYTGDPTFLSRFRGEAQLAAGLVHPNIATLFDYGEVPAAGPMEEHLAYLVMELVRGESLSGLLYREHQLSPARTLDVLRQTAAGLAAAHAAGADRPGHLHPALPLSRTGRRRPGHPGQRRLRPGSHRLAVPHRAPGLR